MTAAALVSVREYLGTTYSPDCDYLDGEAVERHLGEFERGSAQREILIYLSTRYPLLRKRLVPEQRVQVRPARFRVPDVCLLAENAPQEKIVRTPPLLCIEILSPEDTVSKTLERVKDYFNMGVPTCWIIDPINREGWAATPGKLIEATDGILRASGIEMPLADILE